MIGYFFVKRAGPTEFVKGMIGGEGFGVVAEEFNGQILIGAEADFFRTRNSSSSNDLLPGVQGIGGLVWVAPVGQIKTANEI